MSEVTGNIASVSSLFAIASSFKSNLLILIKMDDRTKLHSCTVVYCKMFICIRTKPEIQI